MVKTDLLVKKLVPTTCLIVSGFLYSASTLAVEVGISSKSIKIASVVDLKGKTKNLGNGVLEGIKSAISTESIDGRKIKLITKNDFGSPSRTKDSVNSLIARKPFMFIGNTDTSASPIGLPILVKEKIPALGIVNGSDELRKNQRNILNFRPSYAQEIETVIESALNGGIKPSAICAFVQNDDFGMMAVKGMRNIFQRHPQAKNIVPILNDIIALNDVQNPNRNNLGPVGVYKPKTYISRLGYESLKNWEDNQGTRCKLVITMGEQDTVSRFVGYSRYKDEKWVISLASTTDIEQFKKEVGKFNDQQLITKRLILTHVVPHLSSELPIVQEAKNKLGENFNYPSLEGFILGKIMVHTLNSIEGTISQTSFIDTIQNANFMLGGLSLDFTKSNQGSDKVYMSTLNGTNWVPFSNTLWQDWKR